MKIPTRDMTAHRGAPYDQDAAATRGDFEHSLAWDLTDSAKPILNRSSKTALFTMLGAGESRAVIIHVLKAYAAKGEVAPTELMARVTELIRFDDLLTEGLPHAADPITKLRAAVRGLINGMEESGRVTEALTHAYVASFVVASGEAAMIRDQTSAMFVRLTSATTEQSGPRAPPCRRSD